MGVSVAKWSKSSHMTGVFVSKLDLLGLSVFLSAVGGVLPSLKLPLSMKTDSQNIVKSVQSDVNHQQSINHFLLCLNKMRLGPFMKINALWISTAYLYADFFANVQQFYEHLSIILFVNALYILNPYYIACINKYQ